MAISAHRYLCPHPLSFPRPRRLRPRRGLLSPAHPHLGLSLRAVAVVFRCHSRWLLVLATVALSFPASGGGSSSPSGAPGFRPVARRLPLQVTSNVGNCTIPMSRLRRRPFKPSGAPGFRPAACRLPLQVASIMATVTFSFPASGGGPSSPSGAPGFRPAVDRLPGASPPAFPTTFAPPPGLSRLRRLAPQARLRLSLPPTPSPLPGREGSQSRRRRSLTTQLPHTSLRL